MNGMGPSLQLFEILRVSIDIKRPSSVLSGPA